MITASDAQIHGSITASGGVTAQAGLLAYGNMILMNNNMSQIMGVGGSEFSYSAKNSKASLLMNDTCLSVRSFPDSTVTTPQKVFSIDKRSSDGNFVSNMSILDDGSMSLMDITSSRDIVAETITLQGYGKPLSPVDFRVKLKKDSITIGNYINQYVIDPNAFLIQTYPKDLAAFSQKTLFYVSATTGDIKSEGSISISDVMDIHLMRPMNAEDTPLAAFRISHYDRNIKKDVVTSIIDDAGNATFNTLTLTGSDGAMSLKSLKFVNGDTTYGSIASDTVSFTYDKLNISFESQGIQVNSNYDTPVTLFTATQKYKVTYSVRSDGYVTCNQLKADDSITGKSLYIAGSVVNDTEGNGSVNVNTTKSIFSYRGYSTTIDDNGLTITTDNGGNLINIKHKNNVTFYVQDNGVVSGSAFYARNTSDNSDSSSASYNPGYAYFEDSSSINTLYCGASEITLTKNKTTVFGVSTTGNIQGKTVSTMDASDSSNDLTEVPENALAFNPQTKNLVYRNGDGGLSPISCGEVQSENVISKAGDFGSTFTDIDSPANMGYFRVQGINGDNNTLEFPKYNGQHTIVCYGDENTSRVIKLFLLDNTFTSATTTNIGVKYQYVGITLKPGDILKLTAISDEHDLDGKGYVYVAELKECINAVNNPKVKNYAMPT